MCKNQAYFDFVIGFLACLYHVDIDTNIIANYHNAQQRRLLKYFAISKIQNFYVIFFSKEKNHGISLWMKIQVWFIKHFENWIKVLLGRFHNTLQVLLEELAIIS